MLAFVLVWFGCVLPGHRRGIVKLPCIGVAQVDEDGEPTAGCPMCAAKESGESPKPASPGDPAQSCAICFLRASLSLPPEVVAVDLGSWLLDELILLERISLVEQVEHFAFRYGRAPPMA